VFRRAIRLIKTTGPAIRNSPDSSAQIYPCAEISQQTDSHSRFGSLFKKNQSDTSQALHPGVIARIQRLLERYAMYTGTYLLKTPSEELEGSSGSVAQFVCFPAPFL
jgi:hypothetical protein